MSKGLWRKILRFLRPLMNEIGEVGVNIQKAPGSDAPAAAPAAQESTWDQAQDEYSGAQGTREPAVETPPAQPAPSAGDIKTDGQIAQDGTQPELNADGTPKEPAPAAPEVDLQKTVDTLTSRIEELQRAAEFYKTAFNERYLAEPQQPKPGEIPGQQPAVEEDKLPEGILPPEQWDNQKQIAAYIDHKAANLAERKLEQAYNQTVKPFLETLSKSVKAMQDMVIKAQFKDYDEMVGSVRNDLFTFDNSGNVIGVKDPATVEMIRRSPIPQLALYKYAQARKAPETIKKTIQANTDQILKGLETKPKVTLPQGGGTRTPAPDAAPGWDAPAEAVDKYLNDKKLV